MCIRDSNKTDNSSPTDHRFSFYSANGMLPLVKSIAKDVFRLHTEIVETQERLAAISITPGQSGRKSEGPDSATPTPYSKEVQAIAETVLGKQNRMDACIKELTDLNLVAPETGKPFVISQRSMMTKMFVSAGRLANLKLRFGICVPRAVISADRWIWL